MDLSNIKPLNLDGILGKAKKRVALVGVELEGGWIKLPPGVAGLEHDRSVFQGRIPAGVGHVGELPVGPVTPDVIGSLIKKNYPPKMNGSCGMHVHMSFDKLFHYTLLMVPEYQETILHYLTLWAKDTGAFPDEHHIWGRLRGESKYCQKKFWPDAQASTKRKEFDQNAHGHRYTVIHYCGRQSTPTIECRVLPMMAKISLACSAVKQVIDITDACIQILSKDIKRTRGESKITLPNNMVYEETIVDTI